MPQRPVRRTFLIASSVLAGGLLATRLAGGRQIQPQAQSGLSGVNSVEDSEEAGWKAVEQIKAAAQPPAFPERTFVITDYGAIGDGQTDCTDALAAAIDACVAAGGGRVVVPAGTFLTGPIHLRSRVNLHLERQATLRFSQDPAAYLPAVFTRWQGIELLNYSPFIYAFEQEDVALTGSGVLDGQADASHWWPWMSTRPPQQHADWMLLQQMAAQGVPAEQRLFGAGHYLRPNFVQFYRCRNILVDGVTIINSPMWAIHPVLSENVVVRGVTVVSHGPNNDGCDPESCSNVLIQGCIFDTDDDCIAIKSGRDADGRRIQTPSENVLIEDCEFRAGAAGIAVGSEMSGGVRAVFAQNLRMFSRHLLHCLHIKTNSYRGGFVEKIQLRNIHVARVFGGAIEISFDFAHYEEGSSGTFIPSVRDIYVRDINVEYSRHALYLRGHPDSPIQRVSVAESRFSRVEKPNILQYIDDLQIRNVIIDGVLF